MMQMIMQRLNEPSTWRGIVALLTACGVSIAPAQQTAIIAGGLALMGLLGAFIPDVKPVDPPWAPVAEPPK